MPIGDSPIVLGPVNLPPVQLVGAGVSLVFLAAFTWFFLKSRVGVAMRAVADNQQVAMAMGINVQRYFRACSREADGRSGPGRRHRLGAMLVGSTTNWRWSAKVFPVVILGGLDLDPGAASAAGGLAAGVSGRESGGWLSRPRRRRREFGDFEPLQAMTAVLMIRPEGIFGRRRIERV